ncbi:MAG: PAS domain S-box protein [Candidatus Competibacteraceae bacterium]|nr:PAS domain S-box protein [Candidatus Competibacteraceae bacterium]HRY14902.1 PAS domain S-box protein [Candidatus Competibacteraceae bacterium]
MQNEPRSASPLLQSALNQVLEATDIGVWEYDHVNDRLFWSPWLYALLGYDIGQAPSSLAAWLGLIHRDDLPGVQARIAAALTPENSLYEIEYRLRAADGQWRWFHARGRVMRRDTDGRPLLTAGVQLDISERKHMELLLQTQHEFSAILAQEPTREKLLKAILENALSLPELDSGGLYWREPDNSYRLVTQKGLSPAFFARVEHLAADSPQAAIIREGRLRCSCTPEQEHCTDPALIHELVLVEEGIRSLVVLPVHVRGQPVACLNLASKQVGMVGPLTVTALQALARQFTQALECVFVQEEAFRQQQNLAELFTTINDYLFVLDLEGRILYYNPAVAKGLGYGNTLFGQPVSTVHPPEVHGEIGQIVAEMLAGTRATCPLPLLKADGERIPVDTRVVRGRWNGQPALIGVSRDISIEKAAQIALENEAEWRRALIENSLDGIAIFDEDHRIIEVNRRFAEMLGYAPEEMIGLYSWDIDANMTEADIRAGFAAPLAVNATFETRHRRKDGSLYDAEVSACGARIGGRNIFITITRDISEKKQAEAILRRSEEQYRAVIETSADGFWVVDSQGRLLEVNEAYAHLSGYSRDELRSLSIMALDANENPEEIRAHIDKVRREGSDLFETWHRAKSGRVWRAEVNVSYWPSAGDRFFAFIRDTDRRQRSETLLKIRMRLSQIALTGALDDLMKAALDEAEYLTGSTIAFFHFVEPNQKHLTLQAWSTRTLDNCGGQAHGKGQRYPIYQTDVWIDCVQQRRAAIHNDHASLPDLYGLTIDYVEVWRELILPVLTDKQVVALVGVGNKPEDYTVDDVEALQQLTALTMDFIECKRTQDRMHYLAYHDALTCLPNRVLLRDRLQQAMIQARRNQRCLAICYLDLDDFKPINDTYGHDQGDQILIEVAQRLTACVRAGDTVARLGGDEFVVLLGDLATFEEAERAIDRVLTTLQAPFALADGAARLSASIGVTLYPEDGADADTLLRHADHAMYLAKQAGGHCYLIPNNTDK